MTLLYFLIPLITTIIIFRYCTGGYIRVFIAIYLVIHFVYYLSAYFQDRQLSESYDTVFVYAYISMLIICVTYVIAYGFLSQLSPTVKPHDEFDFKLTKSQSNLYVFVALSFFVFASLFYLSQNGIAYSQGHYAERLSRNAGGGLSIILMYSFIPAVVLLFLTHRNKSGYIIAIIVSLLCGGFFYYLIGGSRNIMASALFVLTYLAYKNRVINKKGIVIIFSALCVLLIALGTLRYGINYKMYFDNFFNSSNGAIKLILDDFSPIFAIRDIITYTESTNNTQYFSTFFNEFDILIPRVIWEDKPINVLNNGYFYTTQILNLKTTLTISPTLAGSFIIMFGLDWYWIWGIITGFVLAVIDLLLKNRINFIIKFSLLCCLGYCFFWARDGLEVYCYMLIKFIICNAILYFSTFTLYQLIPKSVGRVQ